MSEHSLVEPFPTDDLQFALGVEWEMFRQKLKSGEPFSDLVTTDGTPGVVAMCERQERFCETNPLEDFEADWTQIRVGTNKGGDAEDQGEDHLGECPGHGELI